MSTMLEEARIRRGLRPEDVAVEVGKSAATVRAIERGDKHCGQAYLSAWLDLLGLAGDERRAAALEAMPEGYRREVE